MNKYLIGLTAPSLCLMNQPENYIEPYIVEANNLDELGQYVDNYLMRKFALDFKVALSNVKILFASKIRDGE